MPGNLTLFVDTNLFIQCRDVKGLPWSELGDFEGIDLVVCRPVQKEIDDHKGSPGARVARKARAASSLLRSVVLNDLAPTVVSVGPPNVRLVLETQIRAQDPSLEPDDQLVAIANDYCAAHPDRDVRVLTNDTGVMVSARAVSLPYIPTPDGWLMEPEDDRELKAARAEADRLRRVEPSFETRCVTGDPDAGRLKLVYRDFNKLSDAEIMDLVQRARARFPQAPQPARPEPEVSPLTGITVHSVEDARYASYQSDYADWEQKLHAALEHVHEKLVSVDPIEIVFAAVNNGTRPATDVRVEIAARGNFHLFRRPHDSDEDDDAHPNDLDKSRIRLPRPPLAPRPRRATDFLTHGMLGRSFDMGHMLAPSMTPHDSEAFYFSGPTEYAEVLALDCDMWRHGVGEMEFGAVIVPTTGTTASGVVELRIHAANLSEPVVHRVPIEVSIEIGSTAEYAAAIIEAMEAGDVD